MKCIVHIDLDCFYAQVEAKRVGVNCEVEPFLLLQWGMPLAVSYPARAFGITRGSHVAEAIRLCPHVKSAHVATYKIGESVPRYHPDANRASHKVSLLPYRNASRMIFSVFKSFRGVEVEKGGIDEAFLDMTEASTHALAMLENQLLEAVAGQRAQEHSKALHSLDVDVGGEEVITESLCGAERDTEVVVTLSLARLAGELWAPPPPLSALTDSMTCLKDEEERPSSKTAPPVLDPNAPQPDLQSPPPSSFCDDASFSFSRRVRRSLLETDPSARYELIEAFLNELNGVCTPAAAEGHNPRVTTTSSPPPHRAQFTNVYVPPTSLSEKHEHQPASLPPVGIDGFVHRYEALADDPKRRCELLCAAVVTKLVRDEVRRRLGFNCSAGVSTNKEVSKCISAIHKPNQQTLLMPQYTLPYLADLPFQKLRGFGGKLGRAVLSATLAAYQEHIMQYQYAHRHDRSDHRSHTVAVDGESDPVSPDRILEQHQAILSSIAELTSSKRSRGGDDDGSNSSGASDAESDDEQPPHQGAQWGRGWGRGRGGGGGGRGATAETPRDYTTVSSASQTSQAVKRTLLSFSKPKEAAGPSSDLNESKMNLTVREASVGESPVKVNGGQPLISEQPAAEATARKKKVPFLTTCRAAWALTENDLLRYFTQHASARSSSEYLARTAHYVFQLLRGEGNDAITRRTVAKSLMSQKVLTSREDLVGQSPQRLQRWIECLAAELMERYEQLVEDSGNTLRAKTIKYAFGAGGLSDWSDVVSRQVPAPPGPLTIDAIVSCGMALVTPYFVETPVESLRPVNCVTISIAHFQPVDANVADTSRGILSMLNMTRQRAEDADTDEVVFTGFKRRSKQQVMELSAECEVKKDPVKEEKRMDDASDASPLRSLFLKTATRLQEKKEQKRLHAFAVDDDVVELD